MNCGNGGFGHARDRGGATQGIDQGRCKVAVHAQHHAIIGTLNQVSCSDIRDCVKLDYVFDVPMDAGEIKQLIKERGDTQSAIARLLGIAPNKLSKSLKGERRFTIAEMDILRSYFGRGPGAEPPPKQIPVVGLVSAGAWREGFNEVLDRIPKPDPTLSDDAFAVRVTGDSMEHVAKEGDDVIVEPRDRRLVNGKYYVVRNSEGEMTFKQYRENPARLEPCSDNKAHATIYPGEDGFEVIGRVRKKVTDL